MTVGLSVCLLLYSNWKRGKRIFINVYTGEFYTELSDQYCFNYCVINPKTVWHLVLTVCQHVLK